MLRLWSKAARSWRMPKKQGCLRQRSQCAKWAVLTPWLCLLPVPSSSFPLFSHRASASQH